jgi:tetratricopeptide (TPR) repeat protein
LTPTALQQLIDKQNCLITMNGFLSTTTDPNVALMFAGDDQAGKDRHSVLFEFHVNTTMREPFARVSRANGNLDEEERLFSVNTIWRIDSAEPEKERWRIILSSCNELNFKLDELQKQYTDHGSTLLSLGDILQQLGDKDGAEWFYDRMLDQTSLQNETRVLLNCKIGMIQKTNGNHKPALESFEKAVQLWLPLSTKESTESMTPKPHYIYSDQSYLLNIHRNRGFLNQKLKKIPKAIECYRQALNAGGSKSELAAVNNDIGCQLYLSGEYDQSYEHLTKAIELTDDTDTRLPEYRQNLKRAGAMRST